MRIRTPSEPSFAELEASIVAAKADVRAARSIWVGLRARTNRVAAIVDLLEGRLADLTAQVREKTDDLLVPDSFPKSRKEKI